MNVAKQVSATIPSGFANEVGIKADVKHFSSPFRDAYKKSSVFIPKIDPSNDTYGLINSNGGLDTYNHSKFAGNVISDLIKHNNGSALVLSATASGAKYYASKLQRDYPGLQVISQYDGGTLGSLIDKWRNDKHSVLVGTKSLMTGVDAAGETNSLVIIDRIPRSPKNIVDEARSELLQLHVGIDKFSADRLVYVSDAALLLSQAVGRLIRHQSDSGIVAILDPRIYKDNAGGVKSYPQMTRSMYQKPLKTFGKIISVV